MAKDSKKTNFAKSILTVKGVILRDDGKLLLLKRSKGEFNPEKWDLPGGTLEKGETLEEALLREIQEETGLEVEVEKIIGTAEFSKESKNFDGEKRGLRYLTYCSGDSEVKLNKKEHQDHMWLSLEEALEKLSTEDGFENEKRQVILKVQEILEMKKALNGWRRALADLENYKKRVIKENEDFKRYCLEDYILGILPVLDNFELALKHVPEKEANNNWIIGILHIKRQLEDFLNQNGVEEIETEIGDESNENIHEVLVRDEEENEKDLTKNSKIKEIVKRGYKIGDKIIRPVVVKN